MHNLVINLETAARGANGHTNGGGCSNNCISPVHIPRGGATTPAEKRLSRPFEALMVPHKTIKKICCIGAGYVGGYIDVQASNSATCTTIPS